MLPPRSLSRRELIAVTLGTVSGGLSAVACGTGEAARLRSLVPSDSPTASPAASMTDSSTRSAPLQLPRGGRVVLPVHRLVGYCGGPGSAAFGRLGTGDLDARVSELERLAVSYAAGRPVLPVLELITVVAQRSPGSDGLYRERIDPAVVRTYLNEARRHRALLLLNVQPGQARFIDEVRALEPWLRQPDVGLALDPEWAVRRGQVPGRVYGQMTGGELDAVAGYLASLVAAGGLPEKVLVVHQLAQKIILGLSALRRHPGVTVVKSVDGIGPPEAKVETWSRLVTELPSGMRPGFKLFFEEDSEGQSRLMTPAEVLALRPVPDYVMYE